MRPLRHLAPHAYRRPRTPPATNRGVHPFVRRIWNEMEEQRVSQLALQDCTGINVKTLTSWFRGKHSPKLLDVEAVLNALGYELKLVARTDELD